MGLSLAVINFLTSLIGGLRNFVGEIFQPVLIKKPTRAITVLSRNRSAMLVSAGLGMSALLALSVGGEFLY